MHESHFAEDLMAHVNRQLEQLDLLKEPSPAPLGQSEIVQRLRMALKSEIEASELAALWMPSTPEIDVKLALARQVGDEARHYGLIEKHLVALGIDNSSFDPIGEGYGPMFKLLSGLKHSVERAAAAQLTREALALKKNEQFIEFCEASGDPATAALYRDEIQPDEAWHVDLGRQILAKHATTPELQEMARRAADAVLDLAVRIQHKQLKELRVSHAPGC